MAIRVIVLPWQVWRPRENRHSALPKVLPGRDKVEAPPDRRTLDKVKSRPAEEKFSSGRVPGNFPVATKLRYFAVREQPKSDAKKLCLVTS